MWTKIEDVDLRKFKPFEEKIVYSKSRGIEIGIITSNEILSHGGAKLLGKVTHIMPLPDKPEN